MFDIGWTELLLIGIVALIVVGPKDLPVLFRQVGKFVGRAKAMAREFSSAMNDAADQAGVKDVADSLKSATDGLNKVSNPMKAASDAVKESASSFTKLDLDPDSETGKLSKERADVAKKIREATARKALEKKAAEEAAAAEAAPPADTAPADTAPADTAPEDKA